MAGSALEVIPEDERALRGLELAERHFTEDRRNAIAKFLDIPGDDPALLPYLAWCAGLNLSPIAGHVWLIPKKVKGRDGQEDRTTYRPAIGRDGLLHKARETKGKRGGYKGLRSNVVCEHDTFEVEDDGFEVKILHRYASKPTEFADDASPDRYRGRVIGAWAKCYVDGEPPTFYFANLREHGRLRQVWDYNPEERKRKPIYLDAQGKRTWQEFGDGGHRNRPLQEWEGAWDFLSTMILKAAQSYVLRIALGVTGVVPVDELRDVNAYSEGGSGEGPAFTVAQAELDDSFDVGTIVGPEDLRERLQAAIDTANEQDPFSWGPAKCQMVLSGRSDEELWSILEQIEQENDLREQRVAAAAGEQVTDAVIVPELSEEDRAKADALMHRLADLRITHDEADAGSEERTTLAAEMDQIEAELKTLGVDPAA